MLVTITNIFEQLDDYTKKHSVNVAESVFKFGSYLNLSIKEQRILILAALWHDIGKSKTPIGILKKKGPLICDAYDIIKKHPDEGQKILDSLFIPQEISLIVRHHHERFDGTGYPDGLSGYDIPYLSRILSIIDAFDAMTNDRPYRKKLNSSNALQELISNRHTQFDPDIVNAFIKYEQYSHLMLFALC